MTRHLAILGQLPALHAAVDAALPADKRAELGIACRLGCSHCCGQHVAVAPLEVAHLVTWMRANLSPADLDAVRQRAIAVDDATRGMVAVERARTGLACALLGDGGRCVAYEVRPVACRTALSVSAASCALIPIAGERGELVAGERREAKAAEVARKAGGMAFVEMAVESNAAGLKASTIELAAALRIALIDDTAIDRWLDGEDAFADARPTDRQWLAVFAKNRPEAVIDALIEGRSVSQMRGGA